MEGTGRGGENFLRKQEISIGGGDYAVVVD